MRANKKGKKTSFTIHISKLYIIGTHQHEHTRILTHTIFWFAMFGMGLFAATFNCFRENLFTFNYGPVNIHYYCRCFAFKLAGEKKAKTLNYNLKKHRRENEPSIHLKSSYTVKNSIQFGEKKNESVEIIYIVDRKQFFWQFISCVFHCTNLSCF